MRGPLLSPQPQCSTRLDVRQWRDRHRGRRAAKRKVNMGHLVLLGDSIFDNGRYVGPDEPAVIEQVRAALPAGWDATLLAVDGSVAGDVPAQLAGLPKDASHVVVSAGGNDALGHLSMLTEAAESVAEVFGRLAAIGEQFERSYLRMLGTVLRRNL